MAFAIKWEKITLHFIPQTVEKFKTLHFIMLVCLNVKVDKLALSVMLDDKMTLRQI
jgi:hypothetical protein